MAIFWCLMDSFPIMESDKYAIVKDHISNKRYVSFPDIQAMRTIDTYMKWAHGTKCGGAVAYVGMAWKQFLYLICYLDMNHPNKEVCSPVVQISFGHILINWIWWALKRFFMWLHSECHILLMRREKCGGAIFCCMLVLCFQLPFLVLNPSSSKFCWEAFALQARAWAGCTWMYVFSQKLLPV